MRINVTGNAGAGKTTLAARLGGDLGISVFSLDSVVWKPGWRKTPAAERHVEERRIVASPSWIIDGVSPFVRSQADLVVFLDVPRRICAWRALKRTVRYFGRTRPELPYPCPDIRILPRLLHLICRFPARAGRDIRREANTQPDRFHVLGYQSGLGELTVRIRRLQRHVEPTD